MQIKPLASGSKGNAYLIISDYHKLLIECGIPFSALVKKLRDSRIVCTQLEGCLISHAHLDHCKAVAQLTMRGIDCYMSLETAEDLSGIGHHRVHIVEPNETTRWYKTEEGNFKFIPFNAKHDKPCLGFIIRVAENTILYLTDSAYSEYLFPPLTHIMIGVDYDLDILNKNIEAGRFPRQAKPRVLNSHANLDTVKQMLKANDLSKLQEVWLLHLSDRNADEEMFKKEIQSITGVPVYVA